MRNYLDSRIPELVVGMAQDKGGDGRLWLYTWEKQVCALRFKGSHDHVKLGKTKKRCDMHPPAPHVPFPDCPSHPQPLCGPGMDAAPTHVPAPAPP